VPLLERLSRYAAAAACACPAGRLYAGRAQVTAAAPRNAQTLLETAIACLTDSLMFRNISSGPSHEFLRYTVSASGSRHVIYQVTSPPLYNDARLYYILQLGDVSAVGPTPRGTHAKPSYTITPNPVSGHFAIEGPLAKATSITLYNILGQKVGREIRGTTLRSQTLSYSTDDPPGGVYFLHIATPSGLTIQKVLLVR
jgi:hypothetical protein